MPSLFKSESGKKEILRLYDEKLSDLNIDYRYKVVDSSMPLFLEIDTNFFNQYSSNSENEISWGETFKMAIPVYL